MFPHAVYPSTGISKADEKFKERVEKFIKKREKIIKNTPTFWPVKGYIINPFGFIRNAHRLQVTVNNGIDIVTNPGSEVLVAAPGVVISIKENLK